MNELPSTKRLRELFNYNPDTGTLTWKVRPRHHFERQQDWSRWNKKHSGKVVGHSTADKDGRLFTRVRITHDGETKKYINHRVIWKLVTGQDPFGLLVDHINQDPLDNRWSNLRLCTNQENGRNCRKSKNNTSGVNGVYWDKREKRWVARMRMDGSYRRVGTFHELSEAESAIKALFKDKGYSDLHGA